MSKKKKSSIEEELLVARQTLSVNLRRAMQEALEGESNKAVALDKATGVGKSGINRLLKPKEDDPYPKLDTLVRLAHGLGIDVFELLIDAHGMRALRDRESRYNAVDRVSETRDLKRG